MKNNPTSPSPDRVGGANSSHRIQEEKAFMNRFKQNFTKIIQKKGGGVMNETTPEETKGDSDLLNRTNLVDSKLLVE